MRVFASLVRWVVVCLLVLWFLAFVMNNPDLATWNLWPLPYEISIPHGVLVIVLFAIGYIAGALRGYCKTARLRSENAVQKKHLEKLEKELMPKGSV